MKLIGVYTGRGQREAPERNVMGWSQLGPGEECKVRFVFVGTKTNEDCTQNITRPSTNYYSSIYCNGVDEQRPRITFDPDL